LYYTAQKRQCSTKTNVMDNKYLIVVYEPHLLLGTNNQIVYNLHSSYVIEAKDKEDAKAKFDPHLPLKDKALGKALRKEKKKDYFKIDCYELSWVNTGGAKVFPIPEALIKDRNREIYGEDLKQLISEHQLNPILNFCLKKKII